ncbi:hypothetical protein M951_chr3198 (nucleomorph) [Lotharella oceanica]|uniref:Uncharacterized protein n=1 Tax=Lotharella oceanica TaxID=641309 RepID=A0A060DB46_9EUKA|nr:hypothetical protein M951_chr17 [Lotharella oceanica]AIB09703.1 hypothetical protein M951_chr1224 [Lotharella oceanica]AIB09710.1 hypothetical protein M951_chr27 [Lotharella oceanica]AIB09906.1 hypothetical protein M951_chr2214 [Lotharella oceanica]AIB09913.1 hypothetical protein M951_chr37 [Lotharella oceanica]
MFVITLYVYLVSCVCTTTVLFVWACDLQLIVSYMCAREFITDYSNVLSFRRHHLFVTLRRT